MSDILLWRVSVAEGVDFEGVHLDEGMEIDATAEEIAPVSWAFTVVE